jgi:acetylornithine/N-succinyldiaminopimelate aminotransferase
MFGVEHDGVTPDVMTLGKGLGGGFPVAAFLTTEAVAKSVRLGDHGTTFGGNPLACAAAEAVLRVVTEEKLAERSRSLGARLAERLVAFGAEREDLVETVRGRGLLVGLVLRDPDRAAVVAGRALERGVLVNVTAGRVVRFFPALNIPQADLDAAVDVVLDVVKG